MIELNLDMFECRVLGALAEKQLLTPDQYPMTLNALVNACNQLSSRDPVMELTDTGVEAALKRLQERRLTRTYYPAGSRVAKFEQMITEVYALDVQSASVLNVLLLRGPQTAGELRSRTTRMYPFASVESVEHTLRALATKPVEDDANARPALVIELPRAPGTKEPRWAHLLSGEDAVVRETTASSLGAHAEAMQSVSRDELVARVETLERELAALRDELQAFKQQF
jgi:uncharacterized protein